MDKKIGEIIKIFRNSLEGEGIKIKKIVIFGSYAKGTARKHSDIDMIVISDRFKTLDIVKRQELIGLALARAKVMDPIEALGYTEEEYILEGRGTFIGDEVKSKGIEVV